MIEITFEEILFIFAIGIVIGLLVFTLLADWAISG